MPALDSCSNVCLGLCDCTTWRTDASGDNESTDGDRKEADISTSGI